MVGLKDGAKLSTVKGESVGELLIEGEDESCDGIKLCEGDIEGVSVGLKTLGSAVGWPPSVGSTVGIAEGSVVGRTEGGEDGLYVGNAVGLMDIDGL
jgi:hypothetical protein